ncbi:hypothetical protein QQP08_014664 [Theobroma cacao]|nr:hypothetical protein QQP08_014664 [Theobroma cacao]
MWVSLFNQINGCERLILFLEGWLLSSTRLINYCKSSFLSSIMLLFICMGSMLSMELCYSISSMTLNLKRFLKIFTNTSLVRILSQEISSQIYSRRQCGSLLVIQYGLLTIVLMIIFLQGRSILKTFCRRKVVVKLLMPQHEISICLCNGSSKLL